MSTRVTGLENLKLTEAAFRRLGTREVRAFVHLRTYDVSPEVKGLPIPQRLNYMIERADRWVDGLRRRYQRLSLQKRDVSLSGSGVRRWSLLPSSLEFLGSVSEILEIARSAGVRSVHIARVAGYPPQRQSPSPALAWYCVRALVVIRVEHARSGLQNIEDRFVLVRASSFEDAKKRLRKQWRDYAAPYLNSNGQMVSWMLDKVVDVYQTGETELDPAGAEVYSKLGKRRMRPEYIWRPKLAKWHKTTKPRV